jgi:hypothetical protein
MTTHTTHTTATITHHHRRRRRRRHHHRHTHTHTLSRWRSGLDCRAHGRQSQTPRVCTASRTRPGRCAAHLRARCARTRVQRVRLAQEAPRTAAQASCKKPTNRARLTSHRASSTRRRCTPLRDELAGAVQTAILQCQLLLWSSLQIAKWGFPLKITIFFLSSSQRRRGGLMALQT